MDSSREGRIGSNQEKAFRYVAAQDLFPGDLCTSMRRISPSIFSKTDGSATMAVF
jgi:hypothetical protein